MKKMILISFSVLALQTQSVFAQGVQIHCDLQLLNERAELDQHMIPAETKNFIILSERTAQEIKENPVISNYTDRDHNCRVQGKIGWRKAYDKKGKVELTIVNAKSYARLCLSDEWSDEKVFSRVSTTVDFNDPPDHFLLNLPTPQGIDASGPEPLDQGADIRFVHLLCRRAN